MVEAEHLSFICPKGLNISAWGEKSKKLISKEATETPAHTVEPEESWGKGEFELGVVRGEEWEPRGKVEVAMQRTGEKLLELPGKRSCPCCPCPFQQAVMNSPFPQKNVTKDVSYKSSCTNLFMKTVFCCSVDLLFFYNHINRLKITRAVLPDFNSVSEELLFYTVLIEITEILFWPQRYKVPNSSFL